MGKPVSATPHGRFDSPTSRLMAGLALTLAVVGAFCFYALHQIAGLRELQNQIIESNRKDSLQLLRIQNDLNALGLAIRDMLNGDEPYPLYAWGAQFDRIRKDMDDALRLEAEVKQVGENQERQVFLTRTLSQFWISTNQILTLARNGNESQARDLLRNSLQAQQATLVNSVSRLLVENNETQQRTAVRVGVIYDGVERQIYWLLVAALAAISATSLMLIRANRTIFHQMEALSEQRSGLARKLITMQEELFRSISRELHDEFGQMLTAIGAMIARTRRRNCPPELTDDLDEIRSAAQHALDKTRSLSQALHPSILDDGGLEEAIDWYLSVFQKQTGIRVELEKTGASVELADEMPIHVYRVLQEALNNLARHSRSAKAWVRVHFSPDRLRMEVEDRGVGLRFEGPEPRERGMGMIAMRERAELLHGTIEFFRSDGGGTVVRLDVPLRCDVPLKYD